MSAILYIVLELLTLAGPQAAKSDVDCNRIYRCSQLDNKICAYNQSFAATDCDRWKICLFRIGGERAPTDHTEEEYDANLKVTKPFYCQFPIFVNLGACRSGNILPPLNDAFDNYERFWEFATSFQAVSHDNVTEITSEDSPSVNMTTGFSNTKDPADDFGEPAHNGSSVLGVGDENELNLYILRRKNLLLLLITVACLGVSLFVFAIQCEFVIEMEIVEV